MARGIPVSRSLVFVLSTGEPVVDWGDGQVQDILSGEFIPYQESDYGGAISDADLDNLRNIGRIVGYDSQTVYFRSLPDVPRKTID